MARQLYETKEDLGRETSAKERLERRWDVVLNKLPIKYGADWMAFRDGHPVAVVEYKNRPHDHDRFDTYMLSLHKYMAMLSVAEASFVPAVLLVEFVDGLYWAKLGECSVETRWGGRTDRGDSEDSAPCQFIPMSCFTEMGVG